MGRPRRKRMDAGMISTEMIEPLKQGLFRRVLFRSLLPNTGRMIQGVGSGWAMVEMNGTPEQVALVQTALTLPITLFALPAGAIADIYDRRLVILFAIIASLVGSILLSIAVFGGHVGPASLLLFTFLVGSGMALRSEEHTSELQSLMRTSYAVFCLKKKIAQSTA